MSANKPEYDREYYERTKSTRLRRKLRLQAELKRRNRDTLWHYKAQQGCVDCGETDPIVLEFDHRDPASKERDISAMLHRGMKLDRIMIEVAKCNVMCANCHRRKTAAQFWG